MLIRRLRRGAFFDFFNISRTISGLSTVIENMRLMIALLLAALPFGAYACLWDSDTLASEFDARKDMVNVIAGRFARNPPLYFEMRLARVSEEIQAKPESLALYDDAGVACDRLGRYDEALRWMDLKRRQLEAQGARPQDEHWYRYYANVGTFRAHKWLAEGAKQDRRKELQQARNEIAKAIQINPDAHFGREKYQLLVMEWLLEGDDQTGRPALLRYLEREIEEDADAAAAGLAGLVVLGNAWQSVDVFDALATALNWTGDSGPAIMAALRRDELLAEGKVSLGSGRFKPGAVTLEHDMRADKDRRSIERAYKRARSEADKWHEAREEFMLQRLQGDRHPDTDPSFWDGYVDSDPPQLFNPAPHWRELYGPYILLMVGAFALTLAFVSAVGSRIRR
jgi:tetratricopeptide (TPR) repeat protein